MMRIREVFFETPDYDEALRLRRLYLRDPLGLAFTQDDRDMDRAQRHFVVYEGEEAIGAAILVPPGPERAAKIRQMVVLPRHRRRGVGASLIRMLESEAIRLGARRITLSARDTAVAFYGKLGYDPVGELFIAVTIPHLRMEKVLSASAEGAI